MKTLLKNACKYTKNGMAALGIYFLLLGGSQKIQNLLSTNIPSKSELEIILKEEREKLGIEKDIYIEVNITDKTNTGYIKKIENKKYKIEVAPNYLKKETIRHELLHLAKGHAESPPNFIRYYFIQEPQAAMYQIFNIKL